MSTSIQHISKVVRIGTQPGLGNLFCKVVYVNGRLSITGVEGPLRNGNCLGGCGQIAMHEWAIDKYAPGWSAELAQQFRAVWKDWHLNDCTAGSPYQEAYLKAHPVDAAYPKCHYTEACKALAAAGLHPDPNHTHDGKPYAYGSAWLSREVPQAVLAFLSALPDTDVTPDWV